jgi:hypothetical protein
MEQTNKSINAEEETKSLTLFSKVINKSGKDGRVYSSVSIQTKVFRDTKFIQITVDKASYGNKPGKRNTITLDPKNEEVKEALLTAYKK